jgi:exo-beta-1,3-glucanase (GH17 family)
LAISGAPTVRQRLLAHETSPSFFHNGDTAVRSVARSASTFVAITLTAYEQTGSACPTDDIDSHIEVAD